MGHHQVVASRPRLARGMKCRPGRLFAYMRKEVGVFTRFEVKKMAILWRRLKYRVLLGAFNILLNSVAADGTGPMTVTR
jgi:hypothetical protein